MDPGDASSPNCASQRGAKHRTGLFTLLFTDVVGSTHLKAALGDQSGVTLIQSHHARIRELLRNFPDAEEISSAGDSFLLVFGKPSDALRFALQLQRRLRAFNEGRPVAVEDRIGLHMGEVVIEEHCGKRDVHGMQVDTCARVMSLAQAGQILMTRPVFDNARQSLKGEEIEGVSALEWLNHGRFELKGVDEPLEICEVRPAGAHHLSPPTTSEKARRVESAEGEAVPGWRPAVGQLVPHTQWVLEKKLGEGGFGEVWVGRHQVMKERRVFKFCFRADRVRSLKRELTLFRLIKERIGDHPNIVSLREVYFERPPYYVEEEYVAGQNLTELCAAQGGVDKVPLKTKLELVAQIADALQAAHDAGVIHRDVKPGNILISSPKSEARSPQPEPNAPEADCARSPLVPQAASATAKLTDFGIGQVISEEALAGVTKAGFTQTMMSASPSHTGTQLYMAPELLAGKPASTRSDIYSLGVVLYQSLVGDFTRPVTTDWAEDVAEPLLREDLRRCFAGRPSDRFSGAGELARNLRALQTRREALARQEAQLAAREKAAFRRGILRATAITSTIVAMLAVLAIVAITQSRKARIAASRAEAGERRARQNLYAADMLVAAQALHANNRGRAVQLLERNGPHGSAETPAWEWRYLWTVCRSEAAPLTPAHTDRVSDVAFSRGGDLIYSASEDMTIKIWDVASRSLHSTLHQAFPVQAIALSPDGRWLVVGSLDGHLSRWSTQAWTNEPLAVPQGSVLDLLFSPSGDRLVVRHRSEIEVLRWNDLKPIATLVSSTEFRHGQSMAFSGDGELMAYPASPRKVAISDLKVGSRPRLLPGRMDFITSVAFSPDSKILAAGDWSPQVKLWDLATGTEIASLTNHAAWVCSVAFLPDGTRLLSASADQALKFWDTTDWRKVVTLRGHLDEIDCLSISPRGDWAATGGKDGAVNLWSTKPVSRQATRLELGGAQGLLSLDGRTLLVFETNQTVTRWDAVSLQPIGTNRAVPYAQAAVNRAFGVQLLAIALAGGQVEIWDTLTCNQMAQLTNSTQPVSSLRFSPDEALLAIIRSGSEMEVWETQGRQVAHIGPFTSPVRCVEFSPKKTAVAAGMANSTVQIRDLASGMLLRSFQGPHQLSAIAFSPDGSSLAMAGADARLRVGNLANGSIISLPRALMAYFSVTFSPDGQRIAAAGPDPVVRIIEAAIGEEVASLDRNTVYRDFAHLVRFSTDGRALLVLSDEALTVWRAASPGETRAAEKAAAAGP